MQSLPSSQPSTLPSELPRVPFISEEAILSYAPAMILIAVICYGLVAGLRQSAVLKENKTFKALLPLIPGVVGATVGSLMALAKFLWPANTGIIVGGILGLTAGFHMGTFVAIVKRKLGLAQEEKAGEVSGETKPPTPPA
jgi:uncharacterized membrane protein YeaQ/YmgE (transglycosylase-associated protein family)